MPSFISDLTLILMLLTAVPFTLGWRLALRRRYNARRWVHTWAVMLNTVVVLIVMISSFVIFILPGIPGKLGEGSYGIMTVHALVGLVSLVLGAYLVMDYSHPAGDNTSPGPPRLSMIRLPDITIGSG